MKTDRELLELAAKAAGIPYIKPLPEYSGSLGLEIGSNPMRTQSWNPLKDDGDALRLAVKLGLIVETGRCWRSKHGPMFGEDVLPCPYAATRRAIVRAAAEIGASA